MPPFVIENSRRVIVEMAKLPHQNRILIPVIYTRVPLWSGLTISQRTSVKEVWNSLLTAAQKDTILVNVRSDLSNIATGGGRDQTLNTIKDDKARLLHLLMDVQSSSHWTGTGAHQVQSRAELDDRQNPVDHLGYLADAFNDLERSPYRNITTGYDEDGEVLGAIPGMDVAYEICKEINPATTDRPNRNGAWLKDQLRTFKAQWAKVYDGNYK